MNEFNYVRYQLPGARADVAPKVASVELAPINVEALKCVRAQAGAIGKAECSVHKKCRGHLQFADSGIVLLPGMCLTEDPEVADLRTRATSDVVARCIDAAEYGKLIRDTVRGKNGPLRHKMMASQPITSVRGVAHGTATCMRCTCLDRGW